MTEYPIYQHAYNIEVEGCLDVPARDLMKFRWALANLPESGFPYVYHQLPYPTTMKGTYGNEMIHQ